MPDTPLCPAGDLFILRRMLLGGISDRLLLIDVQAMELLPEQAAKDGWARATALSR